MPSRMMRFEFNSIMEFRRMRQSINVLFQDHLLDGGIQLFIALNEAVSNAITHGSQDTSVSLIRIRINVINANRIVIRVKDGGPGFNVVPFYENRDKEMGRGISIMKSLVDKMVYNRTGTEVLLVKKRKKADVQLPG